MTRLPVTWISRLHLKVQIPLLATRSATYWTCSKMEFGLNSAAD